jgi:hypothetical protein
MKSGNRRGRGKFYPRPVFPGGKIMRRESLFYNKPYNQLNKTL